MQTLIVPFIPKMSHYIIFTFFLTLKYNKILCAMKKPLVAKLNWIRPEKNKLSQLKYMCAKKNRTEKEI